MPDPTQPYHPIDCSFYDRLEEAITLKNIVVLEVGDVERTRELKTILVDLFIEDKIEWLRTREDEKIRLDQIQSLNGVPLTKAC